MFRRGEGWMVTISCLLNIICAVLVFFWLKHHGAPYWARMSIAYGLYCLWNVGTYLNVLLRR